MAKSTPPKSCFVVGPIGNNDSDVRKFADWLLRGIIEPVLEGEFGYEVKRADEIAEPGQRRNKVQPFGR